MSENKKPVKVFKKIKHKRPAAQPVKLPPAMSEPDIADADIEALLADNSLEMPNSDPISETLPAKPRLRSSRPLSGPPRHLPKARKTSLNAC